MNKALAIVVYKSEVDGAATGSIDFQVRYFHALSKEEVEEYLLSEEPTCYKNESGEDVCWRFKELVAFAEYSEPQNGDELVGFIANNSELSAWLK